MQRITEIVLMACLMMVMTSYLQQTTAAPSWRPQGRFGKRGSSSSVIAAQNKPYYWRPQGRYGKRSELSAADDLGSSDLLRSLTVSGEVEVPMEVMASGERGMFLRVGVKPCSITGVDGLPPCHGISENAPETY